ncbi:PA3496 family putative envelope integrity protein [Vibrio parahaemolyticus]|uniref:PA3496 family putative envelope integrity protein n=1 Tax=Vibrio parahaemolyticus TaxID=670 RepID=UPI0011221A45|nr:adenosine deaminase [Vibrio parahaemolyticus]TPB41771.1 adenosine deaminase [Vibrio parahaemolyticus]
MLRTSDPNHYLNGHLSKAKPKRQEKSTDPEVRRRIEDILEQRAINKLFEL